MMVVMDTKQKTVWPKEILGHKWLMGWGFTNFLALAVSQEVPESCHLVKPGARDSKGDSEEAK